MFYYISGKLAKLDGAFAVIDAGGVGFKMTISKSTYYRLAGKENTDGSKRKRRNKGSRNHWICNSEMCG